MEDLVLKAFKFAQAKHEGQKDDYGLDYFFAHCNHVYGILAAAGHNPDKNLMTAALLHDTLEDTNTTYVELVREFNEDVANLVQEVTHDGKKDEYGYYFPRLKTRRGIILKFADRLSNLSRMAAWDPARQEHYLRKSKFWKDGTDRNAL